MISICEKYINTCCSSLAECECVCVKCVCVCVRGFVSKFLRLCLGVYANPKMHFLDFLPEIQERIYFFTPGSDLKQFSLCSRSAYRAVERSLWRHLVLPWRRLVTAEPDTDTIFDKFRLARTAHFGGAHDHVTGDSSHQGVMMDNLLTLLNRFNPDVVHSFVVNFMPLKAPVLPLICARLNKVSRIVVRGFSQTKGDAYYCMATLRHVVEIDVFNTGVDDLVLIAICNNNKLLKKLNIGSTRVTDNGISHLLKLKQLRDLGVSDLPGLTNKGINFIACMTEQLSRLELQWNHNINDHGIRTLSKLQQLKILDLSGSRGFSDNGLLFVSSMLTLCELTLQRCYVADTGIKELSKLIGLRRLNLSYTGLTDIGVAELGSLINLEWFDVSHCKGVSDASVEVVVTLLLSLRWLGVKHTSVTHEGVKVCRQRFIVEILRV